MRSTTVLVLVLVAMVGATACAGRAGDGAGDAAAQPPSGEPYIEGEVTSFSPSESRPPITENCVQPTERAPDDSVSSNDPPECGTPGPTVAVVLVEERPEGNKAALSLPERTPIWRETSQGLEPAQAADIAVGQVVAAWVSGPVMESFPVQATADAVVIRD